MMKKYVIYYVSGITGQPVYIVLVDDEGGYTASLTLTRSKAFATKFNKKEANDIILYYSGTNTVFNHRLMIEEV